MMDYNAIGMLTVRRFMFTRNHVMLMLRRITQTAQLQARGTTLRELQPGFESFQDKLDDNFHPTDGAISQFRRTETSNRLRQYSTKTNSCTKLLGVYMDQHLIWKTYVDHVLNSSRDSVHTAQF